MRLVELIAILVAILTAHGTVCAQQQKYPTKPVCIVTVGPGSQNDILASLMTPNVTGSRCQRPRTDRT